jgi:hypothetical protein
VRPHSALSVRTYPCGEFEVAKTRQARTQRQEVLERVWSSFYGHPAQFETETVPCRNGEGYEDVLTRIRNRWCTLWCWARCQACGSSLLGDLRVGGPHSAGLAVRGVAQAPELERTDTKVNVWTPVTTFIRVDSTESEKNVPQTLQGS